MANQQLPQDEFKALLQSDDTVIPKAEETIKGIVVSASKAEVKIDLGGVLIGVVRGPELYEEDDEYANLQPGDEIEATIINEENENGEVELSFRCAGQKRSWDKLRAAFKEKTPIKVKVADANKGGLLVRYKQIQGFLPVSQLAPENYPRVSGGDKTKIFEKLKSFVNKEFEVSVATLEEEEEKIIFSEKDVWSKKQKDLLSKYKVGTQVEGTVSAVTNFGVFINFGEEENLEGLIHISELAWQRIDNPGDLYKVGDEVKAEIISFEGPKIFLSVKKLSPDPWDGIKDRYKDGDNVKGKILKVNLFGLFVKLDENIHGLAHITQLGLAPGQTINEVFKANTEAEFTILSVEPEKHRLGLKYNSGGKSADIKILEKKDDKKEKILAKEENKEDKKNKEDKENKK